MMDADTGLANLDAARALMAVLAAGGRHVVLSPGARNAPLVLAAHERAELTTHVVLDERAAGFVALGLAKATGRAAVLVCTSGSAGGHYLPAVMEACHARVPLVVVTADRPDELQHVGAAQATDQTALFGRHVAAARHLPTPRGTEPQRHAITAAWRLQTAQLLAQAEGSVLGPVHLNAPFGEPLLPEPQPLMPQPLAPTALQALPQRLPPAAADISALVDFARAHRLGAIVCGPMPSAPEGAPHVAALLNLAAALGWPIFADCLSGLRYGVVDGARHTVLHQYDLALEARTPVPEASGVLCIGGQPTSKRLQHWLSEKAGEAVVLTAPGEVQPLQLQCRLQLQGDVPAVCAAWVAALVAAGVGPTAPQHAAAFAAWGQSSPAAAPTKLIQGGPDAVHSSHEPPPAGAVWPTLVAALPPQAGLHVGSSMPVRDLDRFGGVGPHPLRVSASRGLNGIDGFIATLTGLALGDRRPWLGVLGDLTFLHDVGALQAARQLQVTATLVVLNNGGGDIFAKLPIARHTELFERYFRTPQQADIGLLCRACACSHEVVYTGAALGDAVARALSRPADARLHVIEVPVAPSAPVT